MWKILFLAAALAVSVSPVDAADRDGRRPERGELRRDVDRISKEIYRSGGDSRRPPPQRAPRPERRR